MFNAYLCREWAKEASDAFLECDAPLRNSIAKVAFDHALNPDQIQRILEIANQNVFQRLFKEEKDKTFTFPTAKLSEVLEEIKMLQQPKASNVFNPDVQIRRSFNVDRLKDIFGDVEDNSLKPVEQKQKVTIIIEKLAAAQDELNNQLILAEAECVRYLKSIRETVKQLLLDSYNADDLLSAVLLSFPDRKDDVVHMFTSILAELSSEGIKTASASEPVDEKYINRVLENVRVVNGQHPLYLKVRDFFSKTDERLHVESGSQYIRRKIEELKSCLKTL